MRPQEGPPGRLPSRSGQLWLLLFVLAAVQFTHVIDFMIIMPLGPRYARELSISPQQFGFLVSAYAFAAGAAGLLAASVIDRFDRKQALLFLYGGFTLGTLACALATGYTQLLAARAVAGAFGGVLGGLVLAIVGDAFPEERRGLATGVVMSAFSVATIAGVPAGLGLAAHLGTWAPFGFLAGLSSLVLLMAARVLPPLRRHLEGQSGQPRSWQVLLQPAHLRAYALMMVLVLGTFTIAPHLATFLVVNVGWQESQIFWLYLCGGCATLVTMSLFGRLSDILGKLPVFRVMALATMIPVFWLTHLGRTPLIPTLLLTTLFMVCSSGRMVPAMALITSSAASAYRGSFMSINASVQQFAAALASLVAGLLLHQPSREAPLEGYPLVGVLSCATIVVSVLIAGHVRPAREQVPVAETGPSDETLVEAAPVFVPEVAQSVS
jgi:predicted MFS family arabinose efflux permease